MKSIRQLILRKGQAIYIILYTLIIGGVVYAYSPFPPDDFLRHIRYLDYKPVGGYAYMFPYSSFSYIHFNPWYGFDLIVGTMKGYLGHNNTITVIEIAFICLFFLSLLRNTCRSDTDAGYFSYLLLFVFLIMNISLSRLTLIRPAIFMSIIFLFAIRCRGALMGVVISIMGALLYYLFFLYTVPLAIGHYFKGDKRLCYGLTVGTALCTAIWILMTDYSYIDMMRILIMEFTNRDGIVISENVNFLSSLSNPVIFIFLFLFAVILIRTKKVDIYTALVIATLPLAIQIRYFLDITVPLIGIYVAKNSDDMYNYLATHSRVVMDAAALVVVFLIIPPITTRSLYGPDTYILEGINIPAGSIVYADNMPLNFSAIYWSPNIIQVIPSAAIGCNDAETKKTLLDIGKQRVIRGVCGYLKRYKVNYLLTDKPVEDKCLVYIKSFSKGKRVDLWQVQ